MDYSIDNFYLPIYIDAEIRFYYPIFKRKKIKNHQQTAI